MKLNICLAFILFFFSASVLADRTVITINNSSQPIWVGAEGKLVNPADPFNPTPVNPNRGGWYLAPNGGSVTVTVPNGWEGRFWGRTNCTFDEFGNGSCETGNCSAGLYCDGLWGKASTLAEMKFNGWNDLDFYDVSLIDGFNVPIQIVPVPGTYTPNGDYYYAGAAGCETDVNDFAPPELAITNNSGDTVAWMATCSKWDIDKYCCYDNDPATCHPNEYSVILKQACPDAYSYVTDHETSTFASSSGTVYQVVFPEPVSTQNPTKASFYQHCNYDGYGVSLGEGDYTLSDLTANGIRNDDVSSIKVDSGYIVEMFENDNFTGAKHTITAETSCLVGAGWNDRITSLRIKSDSCTPSTLTPYIAVNNGSWLSINSTSASVGNKVALAPHPLVERWTWTGPNGFTATTREINLNNIQLHQAGEYVATYTNESGCKNSISFNVTVSQNGFTKVFQAEDYDLMAGVQIENGAGAEGGQNVGWIDANDWIVFNSINIPQSANYTVDYRVASQNGGGRLSLDFNAGTIQLGSVDIPATGGWFNWITVSHTVYIEAGTYNVGVFANTGGWNLDSFVIRK